MKSMKFHGSRSFSNQSIFNSLAIGNLMLCMILCLAMKKRHFKVQHIIDFLYFVANLFNRNWLKMQEGRWLSLRPSSTHWVNNISKAPYLVNFSPFETASFCVITSVSRHVKFGSSQKSITLARAERQNCVVSYLNSYFGSWTHELAIHLSELCTL